MQAVKPSVRAVAVLVLLFLVALTPLPAGAQALVGVENFDGRSASADFQYFDGPVSTFAQVRLNDDTLLLPPQPGGFQELFRVLDVLVGRFGPDGDITAAHAVTTEFQFSVNGSTSKAHLTANVLLFDDVDGSTLPAVLDLSWEATSGPFPDHFVEHNQDPGQVFVLNFDSQRTFAAVATGTIIYRGENFTPLPSYLAEISSLDVIVVNAQAGNPAP